MKQNLKNKIVICMCYGITAINYIVTWILPLDSDVAQDGWLLALGIIFSIMALISAFENRKEMNGRFAAFLAITLQCVLGLLLSYLYSNGVILFFSVAETLLLVIFLLGYHRNRKK